MTAAHEMHRQRVSQCPCSKPILGCFETSVAETCDSQPTLTMYNPQLFATCAGGGDADGVEYANALAQASFRAVAVAATDVATVFTKDAPELSSLFLVWALQETQR